MARSTARNTQYLEEHRGKWRVTMSVPKELQSRLGTRLKHPLNTDSLTVANQLKWPIVNEMRARIAEAAAAGGGADLRSVAEEFRRQLRRADNDLEVEAISTGISVAIDTVLGKPTSVDIDPVTGEEEPAFDPAKVRQARQFAKIVAGRATPIDHFHSQYMAQLTVKPRTRGDDERAIKLLKRWCEENEVEPFLQSFPSKKAAVRFVDDLQGLEPSLSPVTLNKYINRLSRYWQWLEKREEVTMDVWRGLALMPPPVAHDEKERPFTQEEMVKLLTGETTQAMHDLMRIAALTGCRLDPIVCLRVKDCRDEGVFVFKPQKKEKVERLCPIHSDLKEIVERRTKGKAPDDPFFPEWPGPKNADTKRERSFKTSNQFTAYARSIGVREERDGRRRSLINFHSFRRWFVTAAERAGQPESLIAVVVGHKRQGMTLGVYSAGPVIEQARACVEAVRLPAAR
ncbi:integrase [Metarhizobium album]|uniref:Integrase n=2 Tax=Metarhizobium album TaxID=2182425 RepID=A0A2U2DSR0_9HYPH|nr:integrase [Rhizobium album]